MAGLAALLLAACSGGPSRNRYDHTEAGKSRGLEFATVVAVREVAVTGKNAGIGAGAGGVAGAIAGNDLGNGYGQLAGAVAGAVLGAVAGNMAEQEIADYTGLEYTLALENGRMVTLVQNPAQGEPVFRPGDRVVMQSSGSYQRLLPGPGSGG